MASGKPAASGQERQDFDNPWKEALHEFFPSFLEFFFPDIHADIDWGLGHEFLDAELRQLGRKSRGGRRLPDALVRVVRRNGQEGHVLVHIEIQSQVDQLFTLRVATYNHRIFDAHQLPLVSLVILADPDPRWYPDRYERELWGTRSLLEFRAFKLLDLRDRRLELAASSNPFALLSAAHLAALESGPATRTRLAWKLDLVRSLYRRGRGPGEGPLALRADRLDPAPDPNTGFGILPRGRRNRKEHGDATYDHLREAGPGEGPSGGASGGTVQDAAGGRLRPLWRSCRRNSRSAGSHR